MHCFPSMSAMQQVLSATFRHQTHVASTQLEGGPELGSWRRSKQTQAITTMDAMSVRDAAMMTSKQSTICRAAELRCRRRDHHHCDRETPLLRFAAAAAASLSFALLAVADELARTVIHGPPFHGGDNLAKRLPHVRAQCFAASGRQFLGAEPRVGCTSLSRASQFSKLAGLTGSAVYRLNGRIAQRPLQLPAPLLGKSIFTASTS